ncbi:nitrogen regulatory protein P-II-like protein [Senna tora]|uniref:Nitrogen regulatory protein P-II-like protein n=1 Tax=Senna tora TaxID=362788 RepID=A0A834T9R9_9FABA|nr:nitrogen regulatory protein P-II-like protein [Senna tora]
MGVGNRFNAVNMLLRSNIYELEIAAGFEVSKAQAQKFDDAMLFQAPRIHSRPCVSWPRYTQSVRRLQLTVLLLRSEKLCICCFSVKGNMTSTMPTLHSFTLPNSHLKLPFGDFRSSPKSFRVPQFSLLPLSHKGNAAILPKTRAQNLSDLNTDFDLDTSFSLLSFPDTLKVADDVPDSKFYKVEAFIRPWRLPQLASALLKMGIDGFTVSDVRGTPGRIRSRQRGSTDILIAKVKMEIVVSKNQVDTIINKIIDVTWTGEIDDGKIFLIPVSDVIKIRTGERGEMMESVTDGAASAV